jgi:hypothetical protein
MSKLEVLQANTARSTVALVPSLASRLINLFRAMSSLYSVISLATIRERARIDRDAGTAVTASSIPSLSRDLQAFRCALRNFVDSSVPLDRQLRLDVVWLIDRVDDVRDSLQRLFGVQPPA